MSVTLRRFAAVAIASAVLVTAAACSSDDADSDPDGPITLVVDIFGDAGFGYDELIEKYQQDNPNVTVQQRGKGLGLGDYNTRLTQQITAGSGAGDVVAIEEGTMSQFFAQADKFVDLGEYGANDLKDNFLSWKWEAGVLPDGKVLALGTDVGGMALCYRKDLFEAAGLPSDRTEVSALWSSWDDFIEVGERFKAATPDKAFVDSATSFYNLVLMQIAGDSTGYTYYDRDNQFVMENNPDIKAAFDLTTDMIGAGLSNNLQSFSNEWNAGFKNASFATIACPAWMTGVIEGQAGPEAAGKWDIATAPGSGGNWGGSFLAVPTSSKHQAAAAELVKYLTSPEGQIGAFEAVGNLPSSEQALSDSKVAAAVNEYFSDAPTGEIFAAGASELKPVYLGPKNQAVRTAVENALRAVEQGQTPEAGWQDAITNGTAAGR